MKKAWIMKLLFVLIYFPGVLNAQNVVEDESLNYTYLGPSLSVGYNKVKYTDWIDNSTQTKKMSGIAYSGGFALDIFVDNFCGDFQLKYSYSQLDFTMTNLEFSIAGKYLYPVNNYFSAGGGVGLYFETPPSNKNKNGSAGLQVPVSMLINTFPDTKLFVDIYTRYGTFSIGENTRSISAGVNVGFIFKVGRI